MGSPVGAPSSIDRYAMILAVGENVSLPVSKSRDVISTQFNSGASTVRVFETTTFATVLKTIVSPSTKVPPYGNDLRVGNVIVCSNPGDVVKDGVSCVEFKYAYTVSTLWALYTIVPVSWLILHIVATGMDGILIAKGLHNGVDGSIRICTVLPFDVMPPYITAFKLLFVVVLPVPASRLKKPIAVVPTRRRTLDNGLSDV